jgi:hypothetical protein
MRVDRPTQELESAMSKDDEPQTIFEQLALMGITADRRIRVGKGAAERVLEQARRLSGATAMDAEERENIECAKMLVELAFLLPRGTDIATHSAARQLVAYIDAVRAHARADGEETTVTTLTDGKARIEDLIRDFTQLDTELAAELLETMEQQAQRALEALAGSVPSGDDDTPA